MKNKYKNIKVSIDNIKFDSKAEARRYKELKILSDSGQIVDLELQPKFKLQETFKYNNETIRSITYKADFAYTDIKTGSQIVEDVKGFKTKEYLLKKKIFLKLYGKDVNFYEIK